MFIEYEMGDTSLHKGTPILKSKNADMLPFVVTGMGEYYSDKNYYTKRKDSEQFLVIYTISGEGFMIYDGKDNCLSPGSVMVIDCRKYQHYGTRTERWHFLWMHFSGKCAEDYEHLLNAEGGGPVYVGKRMAFQSYYEHIKHHEIHFSQHSEMEIALVFQKIMTELIYLRKMDEFSMKYDGYRRDMDDSIVYMQNHFGENISIEQLAADCHLSKYYYIKIFKAYMGQTPYDYLLNYRLQMAQSMLLSTEKLVESIANECGFSESKNFIACFKKKAGITPLQFRKQNRLA